MPSLAANCITVPVARWRRWLVGGLAALLILGHAYDTLTMREHWPFSYYPMYSRVQARARLEVLGLYGVVQDGTHPRLEPMDDPTYLPPLQEVHLRNILMTAWGRSGATPAARRNTAKILSDYLHAYEGRRVAGLHHGPRLSEAQLCIATYVLKAGGTPKATFIQPLLGVSADGTTHEFSQTSTQPTTRSEDDNDAHP